ncbi:MAG: NUDIX domain-containing protein [Alphaproteobacteria bacterium]|nr:MAG: NUDIX domain-containing protein [Alphaproteobacteria bacterium]
MKRVQKVVAYITLGDRLLVFTQRDYPDAGVQVPAGTVETGEPIYTAVLREAEEETGLKNLKLVKYLGARDFDAAKVLRPDEIHERHFFHLEAANPAPEQWQHWEMTPSGDDKTPVAFDLKWVEKKRADLFYDFDALLDKIA